MKITIERGLLLKVLAHIQSIVERRNTIPILSNVKFDAPDGRLSLNATDMYLDIVETIPADVLDHGAGAHLVRYCPQASRRRAGGA
jgi:DNA polymerase-3 subunit beta